MCTSAPRATALIRLRKHPMRFPPLAVIGCFPSVPAGPPVKVGREGQWAGIPVPSGLVGMSYSDVSLLLTQFKGALNRYFQRRI